MHRTNERLAKLEAQKVKMENQISLYSQKDSTD